MRFNLSQFCCLIALLVSCLPPLAQAAAKNTSVNFFRGASQNTGYYPGEQVDARTGSLYWEVTDVTLPGQGGFDIEIVRSFNKNGPERLAFGNWELEIPRVTLTMSRAAYESSKKGHRICERAAASIQPASRSSAYGMQLRIPKQRPRDLLIRYASSPHPKRAKFVTNDHWIGYCTKRKLNNRHHMLYQDSVSAFVVESPDGKQYIMDHISQDESGKTPRVTFYASEAKDRHGHWLKYEYNYIAISKQNGRGGDSEYHQAKPSLIKLTAKDGREVDFAYKYEQPSFAEPFRLPRLVQINVNGTTWYYSTKYNPRFEQYELAKVRLPDSSEWRYTYGNVIGFTMKTVTTPTQADINYGYRRISSRYFEGKGGMNAFDVAALAERDITGPYLKNTKWTYSYNVDKATNESVTRVNWGDRRQVEYRFQRGNMTDWNLGLPTVTKVKDLPSGNLVREERWQWKKPTPVGRQWVAKHFHMPSAEHPQLLWRHEIDGHVTTFSDFDNFGYPRKRREEGTATREYTYQYHTSEMPWLLGLVKSETLENIGTKSFSFDAKGRIVKQDHYGQVTHFGYDEYGNLSEKRWMKEGIELKETYSNYYRGKPRLVKKPESKIERQQLSQWALPTSKTNARGYTTKYQYDVLNRIKLIKPPIQVSTSYRYPDSRTVVEKIGNHETRQYSDVFGRQVLKRSVDLVTGEQHNQKTEYDLLGRKSFVSQRSYQRHEARGAKTHYDAINRPLEITNTADGSRIQHCYENCTLPEGVQITSSVYEVKTDARGYKRVLEYETYGNPDKKYLTAIHEQVKKSPSEYRTTRINRNLLGKVLEIQQGGVVRTYTYNAQQRLASEYHPEIGLIEYGYDEVGNRVFKKAGGLETRYQYDDLNRLVAAEYGDGLKQTRQYDANDNLIKLSQTGLGKETHWTYQYNAKDQLVSETLEYDGNTYTLGYTYNAQGHRESELLLGDRSIDYQYDGFGRVISVENIISKVDYYPNGGVKAIHYPDGSVRSITQNSRLLPSHIQYRTPSNTELDISYLYDLNGNLNSAANSLSPEENLTLNYDGINRLVQADGRWGLGHIAYDEQDNIKSYQLGNVFKSYIYDIQNRLEQVETSTFSPVLTTDSANVEAMQYDNFGNLIGKAGTNYHFNQANQMISAETAGQHNFVYDGHGHRVEKSTATEEENSIYDQAGNLRVKVTEQGAEYYVRLKQESIAKLKGADTLYYQNDLMGSPKLAVNQAGEIQWRQDYSPYGLELLGSPNKDSQGYTGHQHDKALGLTYMKARYYDPSIGRFLSIDPAPPEAKTPASFNRYSYAANNPYKYVDPDGEAPLPMAILAGTAGLIATGLMTYDTYQQTGSWDQAKVTAIKGTVYTGLAVGTILAGPAVAGSTTSFAGAITSAVSSAVGTLAVGGSTKDIAMSAVMGFGFGLITRADGLSGFMSTNYSGFSIGVISSLVSQAISIDQDPDRTLKDINYMAVLGSGIGGKFASKVTKGAGDGMQAEISTFGRTTISSAVPSTIGEKIGE